ncbi:class I SAM-dependent methyltransferase [Algoriphagus hitonicola]|uniref:Methyltransferase domain-containing protein n=1 Tax=Algoriphagus hitonicola TaxID=435880 RepID=A0A1I2SDV5_9BACT|nr:class I SAM-dependent methyltransferase [Algoriphagus hitonicola]SFG49117.1 Methyltransferase domain-containing protein [Algoriphagus hitonicola]
MLAYSGFKNLHGFDPYIQQETQRRGLTISKKALEQIEGTFDVVMLHHSFEHLADPNAAIEQLVKLLNPDGKLLIRLPVTDGVVWKMEREFWFQLDAPRHLFIPSVKGMKILGTRHGLKLEKVVFDSTGSQFWATEGYKKGLSLNSNPEKHFSKLELDDFEKKAEQLNQLKKGDQAGFYFKRY